jgi:hypothetical protein
MQSVEGVITLVQEGRFAVVTDGGRVMHFLLRTMRLSNRKTCRL